MKIPLRLALAAMVALAGCLPVHADPTKLLYNYGLQNALDANNQRIINLPTPTSSGDAATKAYADGKQPANAALTTISANATTFWLSVANAADADTFAGYLNLGSDSDATLATLTVGSMSVSAVLTVSTANVADVEADTVTASSLATSFIAGTSGSVAIDSDTVFNSTIEVGGTATFGAGVINEGTLDQQGSTTFESGFQSFSTTEFSANAQFDSGVEVGGMLTIDGTLGGSFKIDGENLGWATTTTWNPSSIAAGATTTTTVSVTGAAVGDVAIAAPPAAIEGGLVWVAYVSATNVVTVRLYNSTASSIDPASGTWTVKVLP